MLDLFRKAFSNVLEPETFPVAEINFPKICKYMMRNIMVTADDAGAHDGSFEVAGVNSLNLGEAQPFSELFELEDAHLGEEDVGVPVNGDPLIAFHLSVSDEIKPGAFFHGKAS